MTAAAENMQHRNQLDDKIIFQVVPERVLCLQYAIIAMTVAGIKKIGEIFFGVCKKQMIFNKACVMIIPCVAVNVFMCKPACNYACSYFAYKQGDDNLAAKLRIFYKANFSKAPA